MKLGITAALAFVALLACSSALPAKKRMVYYHQPAAAQFYGAPQRMMYVQYVQPVQTHARSTQGAEALVAGDAVATGTYLKDCDHPETAAANDDVLAAAGAHGAQSVAEAYPAEPAVEIEAEAPVAAAEPANDEAKVPREYNFNAAAPAAEEPEPVAVAAPVPAAAPVKPANRYLPAQKKKVIVELEQPSEEEENNTADEEVDNAAAVADEETAAAAAAVDDEQEEDDVPAVPVQNPVRVPNARRPAVRKPTKAAAQKPPAKAPAGAAKPLPAGTFFPIDFGGTNGGAIAIANSFSTGEGGSATSHAIAYGSPDAVRARARPSKYH